MGLRREFSGDRTERMGLRTEQAVDRTEQMGLRMERTVDRTELMGLRTERTVDRKELMGLRTERVQAHQERDNSSSFGYADWAKCERTCYWTGNGAMGATGSSSASALDPPLRTGGQATSVTLRALPSGTLRAPPVSPQGKGQCHPRRTRTPSDEVTSPPLPHPYPRARTG